MCPKSQGKPKRNQKNNPVRRIWSKSIPDCFFLFFWVSSFFSRFFGVPSPNCPKTRGKPKKKKNNPVRRILGKSIQDWFFWFFLVYLVFLEVFAVPSPTVQKLEENQKKQKKTILWEESCVSPFRIGFLGFFGLFGFSRGFCCPKPNCPKTRGKPKKNKKNNPVRRILGKSIQDWFFFVFWFIWVFSRFLLSQAQLSKNSRNTKKTNPVRRIVGLGVKYSEVFRIPFAVHARISHSSVCVYIYIYVCVCVYFCDTGIHHIW